MEGVEALSGREAPAVGAGEVEAVAGRALVRRDPGEGDADVEAVEGLEEIVEQTQAVGGADFEQGELRVGVGADEHLGGEGPIRRRRVPGIAPGVLEEGVQVEWRNRERLSEPVERGGGGGGIAGSPAGLAGGADQDEGEVVTPGIGVEGEDIKSGGGEGAGDPGEERGPVPTAEGDFEVALLGPDPRLERWGESEGILLGAGGEETMEELEVIEDGGLGLGLEVAIRHAGPVGIALILPVGGHVGGDAVAECGGRIGGSDGGAGAGEARGGGLVQFPDQDIPPIGPLGIAGRLVVGPGQEGERVEGLAGTDELGEGGGGFWVLEIAVLGGMEEGMLMADEEVQEAASVGGEAEAGGDLLGGESAGFVGEPVSPRASGVVEQEGEVEDERVRRLEEQAAVTLISGCGVGGEGVEFLEADQAVFVDRIAEEKVVLEQAGDPAELGKVAAQEIDLVHEAEDASHVAGAGEESLEDLAGFLGGKEVASDQGEAPADELAEVGSQAEAVALDALEDAHHGGGVLVEDADVVGFEGGAAPVESGHDRVAGIRGGEPSEAGEACEAGGGRDGEAFGDGFGEEVDAAGMEVVVLHESLGALLGRGLGVVPAACDFLLERCGQEVTARFGAREVVHFIADPEQEVIGPFELAGFAGGEHIFLDEVGDGAGAGLEVADPDEIVVVAETAAAILDVGLEQGDRHAVALMAFGLVLEATGDVGLGMAADAVDVEFTCERREMGRVAGQEPALEE